MHLQASEKTKGTQYLTLLLPLSKRKASANKAQSILITLFLHIIFNSASFVRTESPYSTIFWGSSENYTVSQEHSVYTGQQWTLNLGMESPCVHPYTYNVVCTSIHQLLFLLTLQPLTSPLSFMPYRLCDLW